MGSYLEHTFQSLSISVSVSVSPSPLTYTRFRFQGTMRAPVTLPPSREPRGAGKKVTTHLALGHGLRAAPSSLLFVLTCFTHCPFSYLCTHSLYSPLGAEENDCYQVHFSSPFFSIFFSSPTTIQFSLTITQVLRRVRMFCIVTPMHTNKDFLAS